MAFLKLISRILRLKFVEHIVIAGIVLLSLFLLIFFVKGDIGTPIYYQEQSEQNRQVGGPFESSNSTSRYALTEAIVENKTVLLTEQQAGFASPDVSRYNEKFLSIFMPGISFIGVPFYLLGKSFGLQQLFTYFSVTLFGFIDMILIAVIVYRLGVNVYASLLSGFLFLFATNALSYSLFYTQHSTSVTFLLLSILMVMGKRTVWKTVLFGLFVGAGLLLDVPNLFFLLPVGIYLLIQHLDFRNEKDSFKMSFNTKFLALFAGLIPFLVILVWYNLQATGTYTKIGQTIGRTNYFSDIQPSTQQVAEQAQQSSFSVPFVPRLQINGIYTLLISNERAWIYYSPIVLFGIFGLILLYKEKSRLGIANTLVGIVLINILLYSMFGDPWGGWAFGPRYLIPAAAILCIGLGVVTQAYKNRLWFFIIFCAVAGYSLFMNSLGALTTSTIPPRVEAIHFDPPMPFTYDYNIRLANENQLSSVFYNLFLSRSSAWIYIYGLTAALVGIMLILYVCVVRVKERSHHE